MKNTIYIEIDTEKDTPIMFGKAPDAVIPKNAKEAGEMVLIDIRCLTEALMSLIYLADQNNYGDKKELLDESILKLQTFSKTN